MKNLFVLLIPLLFVASVSIVFAQSDATTTSEEEVIVEEQEVVAENREQTIRQALSERAQERIINLAANLSNRLDAVINRLDTIMARLKTRLNKLEAAGTDVSEARSYLRTAETALAAARQNMTGIDDQVLSFATASDARANWSELKERYTRTRDLVRSAHADMRSAVLILKNPPIATEDSDTERNQELITE